MCEPGAPGAPGRIHAFWKARILEARLQEPVPGLLRWRDSIATATQGGVVRSGGVRLARENSRFLKARIPEVRLQAPVRGGSGGAGSIATAPRRGGALCEAAAPGSLGEFALSGRREFRKLGSKRLSVAGPVARAPLPQRREGEALCEPGAPGSLGEFALSGRREFRKLRSKASPAAPGRASAPAPLLRPLPPQALCKVPAAAVPRQSRRPGCYLRAQGRPCGDITKSGHGGFILRVQGRPPTPPSPYARHGRLSCIQCSEKWLPRDVRRADRLAGSARLG